MSSGLVILSPGGQATVCVGYYHQVHQYQVDQYHVDRYQAHRYQTSWLSPETSYNNPQRMTSYNLPPIVKPSFPRMTGITTG